MNKIVIIIESFILSIFFILGIKINTDGYVNFSNIGLYFSIIVSTIFISIIIYYFYKFLVKREKEIDNKEITIKKKKYIIIFLILLVSWIPLFLASFPGYFCYDAPSQYNQLVKGEITTHHPVLHTIFLSSIVHFGYLLFGSYNIGIAIFMVLQMILASAIFTYTIYFMNKYKVSKVISVIACVYYALFPTIQMFVLNSSKDTLFTLITLLLIMCLIDIWYDPKKFIQKKRNIVKYYVLITLFCALRNNALIAIIIHIFTFFKISKDVKLKFIILTIVACIVYQCLLWGCCYIFDIEKGPKVEMFSVPIQQLGYVYTYSPDKLTDIEKETIESIFLDDALKIYNPQLSDPLKDKCDFNKLTENIDLYIKLGLRCPSDYINSFLINTVGYWYPNQVLDGYNMTYTQFYNGSKTCYFMAYTEEPGERTSYFPWLENIYYQISRQGIVENIPIINCFFSIGAIFWFLCIIIGYSICQKRYNIVYPLLLIILLWGTMLLGPIVLVRYMLILFFAFPLFIALLFNNKCFENKEKENNKKLLLKS